MACIKKTQDLHVRENGWAASKLDGDICWMLAWIK